jgi:hypothetical protein
MQFVGSFDPSAALNGYMNVGTQYPGCKVLLYNLSIVAITLNFEDGTTDILHAGEAKYWELDSPCPTLAWSQYVVLNAAPGPVSIVTVTTYDADEHVAGTYPMSLIYLLNLGNSVPLSTSATSIANTGNPAGTDILTAQVSGDGGNAVVLTNDAMFTLGDALHPGLMTVTTVDATTVNCTMANVGTVDCTTINVDTIVVNTILDLLKGSITRVGRATGSNTQTITHDWSHQADIVIPYYNGAFGVPPSQALAVQNENANSFQVVGQTGYTWTVFYLAF